MEVYLIRVQFMSRLAFSVGEVEEWLCNLTWQFQCTVFHSQFQNDYYFTTQNQHLLRYPKIFEKISWGGRNLFCHLFFSLCGTRCVVVMSGIQEPTSQNVSSISVSVQTLNGIQRFRRRRHCRSCRCVCRSSDVPTFHDLPQVIRVKGCFNRSSCERHHHNQKVSG